MSRLRGLLRSRQLSVSGSLEHEVKAVNMTEGERVQQAATELRSEGSRWLRWIGALLFVVLIALFATLWTLRSVDAHVDKLEVEVEVLRTDNEEMRAVLQFVDRLLCDRLPDEAECQPEE